MFWVVLVSGVLGFERFVFWVGFGVVTCLARARPIGITFIITEKS